MRQKTDFSCLICRFRVSLLQSRTLSEAKQGAARKSMTLVVWAETRIIGIRDICRRPRCHMLNMKQVAIHHSELNG